MASDSPSLFLQPLSPTRDRHPKQTKQPQAPRVRAPFSSKITAPALCIKFLSRKSIEPDFRLSICIRIPMPGRQPTSPRGSRTWTGVLISLREDYLAPLEGLKSSMPSITQNRLRLAPMTGAQALEAVRRPRRACDLVRRATQQPEISRALNGLPVRKVPRSRRRSKNKALL